MAHGKTEPKRRRPPKRVRDEQKADLAKREGEIGNFAPIGAPGLKHYGGIIREEFLPEFRGATGAKTIREMVDNEPIIGAFLLVTEMLTRQSPWRVEPAVEGDPRAEAAAEFVESCINDMQGGMGAFMTEFLTALPFGWAVMEKLHKVRRGYDAPVTAWRSAHDDGRVGWRRFALRGQDTLYRWDLDSDGEITAMQQQPPPDFTMRSISRDKFLHVRFRHTKNNPEGYSIVRPAYTSWYTKKGLAFVEAVGIERDLAGYPVMEIPPEVLASSKSTDTAIVDAYEDMVRKIKRDEFEGVVIPSETDRDGNPTGFRLRLLNSGGRRPVDVDPVIKRYESRIAMSMMSEFLLIGQDKAGGSFALVSDKSTMFSTALGTILDVRDDLFNRDAIPELMQLNGVPLELSPKLRHGDVETPSLPEVSAYVAALANSGAIVVDDRLEEHLREIGSLPEPEPSTSRLPAPSELPMFGQL